MSVLHDELCRRLAANTKLPADERPEDIADIRKWFMDGIIEHDLGREDMSPVEHEFMGKLIRGFLMWQASQTEIH
jgi:hypothetical protein